MSCVSEELILFKPPRVYLLRSLLDDSPSITQQLCLCHVLCAGTDVMLLDNFSTDGSSHPLHHGSLSGKRRSSVTFEDQVEHSKGMCCLPRARQITEKLFDFGFRTGRVLLTGCKKKKKKTVHLHHWNLILEFNSVIAACSLPAAVQKHQV